MTVALQCDKPAECVASSVPAIALGPVLHLCLPLALPLRLSRRLRGMCCYSKLLELLLPPAAVCRRPLQLVVGADGQLVELGEGAFAIVYLGKLGGVPVAVKVSAGWARQLQGTAVGAVDAPSIQASLAVCFATLFASLPCH